MTRFSITGQIGPREIVQHVIKARSKAEAWARFKRSWPGRECVLVRVDRLAR